MSTISFEGFLSARHCAKDNGESFKYQEKKKQPTRKVVFVVVSFLFLMKNKLRQRS